MNNSQSKVGDQSFDPFYEAAADWMKKKLIAPRVIIAALPGLLFVVFHYCLPVFGESRMNDWSWFLGILITTATLCVYYATHRLKALTLEINARLGSRNKNDLSLLAKALSNRKFVVVGLVFASLNLGVGSVLGPPYSSWRGIVFISAGYLVAGFVCGMAVLGIVTISKPIKEFANAPQSRFDFSAPDHCGGTGFVGDALIVFASVTLVVGVMISIYISKTDWLHEDRALVTLIKDVWVVFPYLCSLVALLGPAIPINVALRDYKKAEDVKLGDKVANLRQQLDQASDTTVQKELREQYEFFQNRRKDVHAMRTWPFSLDANVKYASVFGATGLGHISTATDWMRQWFHWK